MTKPQESGLIERLCKTPRCDFCGEDPGRFVDSLLDEAVTALEAAQARIAELEKAVLLCAETALSARAEALEEAARVADDHLPKDMWESRDSSTQYNLACRHIAAAVRHLKEKPNGDE